MKIRHAVAAVLAAIVVAAITLIANDRSLTDGQAIGYSVLMAGLVACVYGALVERVVAHRRGEFVVRAK